MLEDLTGAKSRDGRKSGLLAQGGQLGRAQLAVMVGVERVEVAASRGGPPPRPGSAGRRRSCPAWQRRRRCRRAGTAARGLGVLEGAVVGAELLGGDLPVLVGVDLVEMGRQGRCRLGLGPADRPSPLVSRALKRSAAAAGPAPARRPRSTGSAAWAREAEKAAADGQVSRVRMDEFLAWKGGHPGLPGPGCFNGTARLGWPPCPSLPAFMAPSSRRCHGAAAGPTIGP
jgi:hypothetical protein